MTFFTQNFSFNHFQGVQSLRYNFVIYLLLVFLAIGFTARGEEATAQDSNCIDTLHSSLSDARESVCQFTNSERTKYRDQALHLDAQLSQAAQKFARDMSTRGYFSHVSPEGHDLKWRLNDGRIVYMSAGENIAWGYKTSSEVVRGWMNSPGHRRNILNNKFSRIGVGYSNTYWVQIFAN
jgi:uncharacterized protein YkwD